MGAAQEDQEMGTASGWRPRPRMGRDSWDHGWGGTYGTDGDRECHWSAPIRRAAGARRNRPGLRGWPALLGLPGLAGRLRLDWGKGCSQAAARLRLD